jgi:hypothetical protein
MFRLWPDLSAVTNPFNVALPLDYPKYSLRSGGLGERNVNPVPTNRTAMIASCYSLEKSKWSSKRNPA